MHPLHVNRISYLIINEGQAKWHFLSLGTVNTKANLGNELKRSVFGRSLYVRKYLGAKVGCLGFVIKYSQGKMREKQDRQKLVIVEAG